MKGRVEFWFNFEDLLQGLWKPAAKATGPAQIQQDLLDFNRIGLEWLKSSRTRCKGSGTCWN
jgi:hypothetical protein